MQFTYSTGDTPLQGYTIKRGIGLGGFGEVYFAISTAGKEVAIKRVQRHLDVELRGVSHCLNLKHPNLVALHDVRRDDLDQSWIVMEYVSGGTLRDALECDPQGLPREQVLRWFGDMAAAVGHLHEHGIVHRDLKPSNVFDDGGIVKIGDYGLSKFISTSRRGGNTESVGTFHYMAPEIGRGEYGKEIDIYALGIMLYEMLTGNLPFDGESSQEIIMKHLSDTPDLSSIESPYRHVIEKSLQKNPQDRQQSVSEMLLPLGIELNQHGLAQRIAPAEQSHAMQAEFVSQAPPQSEHRTYAYDAQREPLAGAAFAWSEEIQSWWRDENVSPVFRWVAFGVAALLLLLHSAWVLPLLSVLAVVYLIYYAVRSIVLTHHHQPSYAAAHAAAQQRQQTQPRPVVARMSREQRKKMLRQQLTHKPKLTHGAELSEGMLTSLVVIAILGWLAHVFGATDGNSRSLTLAPYVWGAATALLGTWTMLVLGKTWEGHEGHGIGRRLIQLASGALLGSMAYGLGIALMVPMDQPLAEQAGAANLKHVLYNTDGAVTLPAMMVYFAAVFFCLRWWRMADPLRSKRLSIWAVAVVIVANWIVNLFVPIAQPWGMLTAAAIAIATQMSSPWVNVKQTSAQQVIV